MGLNKSKGNMYVFITHTWNTVKGKCLHDCKYCYMKRWGELNPMRLDQKEFNTNLGKGNFIFVGSSCDMFASDVKEEWIEKTIYHCSKFDNKYLFQTKNPAKINRLLPPKSFICVTIESDIFYPEIMRNSPKPWERVEQIKKLRYPVYITIEPILDFNLKEFVELIKQCNPLQVNIGADTGGHNLPEPPKSKIMQLIKELSKFTIIHNKGNLDRKLRGLK